MNSLIRGIVGQGTTAAAFSPSDISNLAIWLDSGDTATITDTSGAVNQWDDKSVNARHVFDTAAGSPTTGTETINGLNVIDFPGGGAGQDDTVLNTSASTTLTQPFTMVFVGSGPGADRAVGSLGDGAVFLQLDSGPGTWAYYAGTVQSGTTTMSSGQTSIVVAVFDSSGGTSQLRVNGVQESTADPGTNSLNLLQVGADGNPVLEWGGVIASVLVYDKALSTQEVSDLETYLGDRWGVTIP